MILTHYLFLYFVSLFLFFILHSFFFSFFFFNDTATTEIYTLSLHDALPIFVVDDVVPAVHHVSGHRIFAAEGVLGDRKSTRLNSSHSSISYAVFCLKKKKKKKINNINIIN